MMLRHESWQMAGQQIITTLCHKFCRVQSELTGAWKGAKGMWTQNIRWTLIDRCRSQEEPKTKKRGAWFCVSFCYGSHQGTNSVLTFPDGTQHLLPGPLLPEDYTHFRTTRWRSGYQQKGGHLENRVKGLRLVLSWLLTSQAQQELRKSSSKPTSDTGSGMWGKPMPQLPPLQMSKWPSVTKISIWLGFCDGGAETVTWTKK